MGIRLEKVNTANSPSKGLSFSSNRAFVLRAYLTVAFMLGPFLPASNILFYVGTYIGERVLYLPSMGFCMLMADLVEGFREGGGALVTGPTGATKGVKPGRSGVGMRGVLASLLVGLLLCGYSVKTVTRNRVWVDEGALFTDALTVCPDSAKVQLNAGILARRTQQWDSALGHFFRAMEIDHTYCEPHYWIGLTYMNTGDQKQFKSGVSYMEQAVECIYTRVQAVTTLNIIYMELQQVEPEVAGNHLESWARIMVRVDRPEEACMYFLEAALTYEAQGKTGAAHVAKEQCRQLRGTEHEDPNSCSQLQDEAKDDPSKAFAYVSGKHAKECRMTPGHQRLIHQLQSADTYNPWLQWEWAEIIVLQNASRGGEAVIHLNVAGKLFRMQTQQDSSFKKDFGVRDVVFVTNAVKCIERALELKTETISRCQLLIEYADSQAQLANLVKSPIRKDALLKNVRSLLDEVRSEDACSTFKELLPSSRLDF